MKKSIIKKLKSVDKDSVYIPVKQDGHDVIRVGNHLPNPKNLFDGEITEKCKNIYLIFVKSKIDKKREDGIRLARLIHLIESNDPKEKIQGKTELNNLLVKMGNDIQKGINYQIINGDSDYDIKKTTNNIHKMLKATVFTPLKYIN